MSVIDTRRLRVTDLDATRVVLAPVDRCEGCATCAGRCTGILSAFAADDGLTLAPGVLPGAPAVGDEFLLRADRAALGRAGSVLRGLPLAGLLLGAVAGALVAGWLPAWRDALVAVGAIAGIVVGLRAGTLRMRRQATPFTFVPCPNPEKTPSHA